MIIIIIVAVVVVIVADLVSDCCNVLVQEASRILLGFPLSGRFEVCNEVEIPS